MAYKGGYKPTPPAAIRGGVCSKCGDTVTPSGICMTCHHAALDAAGFDWRQISQLRGDMGGGAGGWRARHEESVALDEGKAA